MIILYTLIIMLAFWYVYIFVMGLYRAYLAGRLTGVPLALSLPGLAIGYGMDYLVNWTIASALFWQIPQHPFEKFTDRLIRYLGNEPDLWRGKVAYYVCVNLLDPFDPRGVHCDIPNSQPTDASTVNK